MGLYQRLAPSLPWLPFRSLFCALRAVPLPHEEPTPASLIHGQHRFHALRVKLQRRLH